MSDVSTERKQELTLGGQRPGSEAASQIQLSTWGSSSLEFLRRPSSSSSQKNKNKMRRLTRKKALTLVRELDAFPKVPESYVESSASGGTGRAGGDSVRPPALWTRRNSGYGAHFVPLSPVSLIAFTCMAVLAVLEFFVYRHTWMRYEYEVDKDYTR